MISQTTHTFKQSTSVVKPSYRFVGHNVFETWGCAGCMLSEVGIKIDPKGMATLDAKLTGWIRSVQAGLAAPASRAGSRVQLGLSRRPGRIPRWWSCPAGCAFFAIWVSRETGGSQCRRLVTFPQIGTGCTVSAVPG
ncbi:MULTISPECIES: hypothetical protein [Streptomyces]|uniref:hypothetical protein n=1 Tax=Streptomyces TaxID=1883 RepID=UPI00345B525A